MAVTCSSEALVPSSLDDPSSVIKEGKDQDVLTSQTDFENTSSVLHIILDPSLPKDLINMITELIKDTVCLIGTDESRSICWNHKYLSMSSVMNGFLRHGNEMHLPATKHVIQYLLEYIEHHHGIAPQYEITRPLKSNILSDNVCDKFDCDFIQKVGERKQDVYDLMEFANYLDLQPLLHLGAAYVACWIKGKPINQVRAALGI